MSTGTPFANDCPCPFEWNGRHYIIQGFCTMAKSESGANASYTDEVLAEWLGADPEHIAKLRAEGSVA